MRLRRRAAGLIVGAVVLFVIGTNAQAGWLFVLAALLLGTAVAGIVVPLVALRGLEVELTAPAETRQGGGTGGRLAVTNRKRAVRWGIVAHDLHVGGANMYLGAVRPGERVEVWTEGGAPRPGGGGGGWGGGGAAPRGGGAPRGGRTAFGGAVRRRQTPPPPPGGRDHAR